MTIVCIIFVCYVFYWNKLLIVTNFIFLPPVSFHMQHNSRSGEKGFMSDFSPLKQIHVDLKTVIYRNYSKKSNQQYLIYKNTNMNTTIY